MSVRVLAIGLLLAVTIACASPTSPDLPTGATRITGTVHFYTLEGGFWAVRGDDGKTYDPKDGLPAAFQQENLRVEIVATVRNDLGGVQMVGPIVEIISITQP